MDEKNIENSPKVIPVPNEHNRLYNLIWLILYSIFIIPSVYYVIEIIKNHTTTDYPIHPILFIPVAIIVFLFLLIPKKNNFFTLFIFIPIGLISNVIFAKFYDLTWLFYPEFIGFRTIDSTPAWWISFGSWGMAFLIVSIILYILMSSFLRVLFKKTYALLCLLLSLLITCIVAYILFFVVPQSFTFPKTELNRELDSSIVMEFINPKAPENEPKVITSAKTTTSFSVYASGLSKGSRYGMRILSPNQTVIDETSTFYYCKAVDCQYELGQINSMLKRLDFGTNTIQIIAQKGRGMIIVAEKKIKITEPVIKSYKPGTKYPCELWLTLEEDMTKRLLIDVGDTQKMTNIGVWVQCDNSKTYDVLVEVGIIGNETQYYSEIVLPNGEPTRIVSLGGNVANGPVRLIVDNQAMGEAVIDRGF